MVKSLEKEVSEPWWKDLGGQGEERSDRGVLPNVHSVHYSYWQDDNCAPSVAIHVLDCPRVGFWCNGLCICILSNTIGIA
jgi:hypothetical protein